MYYFSTLYTLISKYRSTFYTLQISLNIPKMKMYGMIRQHVLKRLFDADWNTDVLEVLAALWCALDTKRVKKNTTVRNIQLKIKLNVLPDKTCSLWRISTVSSCQTWYSNIQLSNIGNAQWLKMIFKKARICPRASLLVASVRLTNYFLESIVPTN